MKAILVIIDSPVENCKKRALNIHWSACSSVKAAVREA